MTKRVTTRFFSQAKEKGERITMLTAYDFLTAKLLDEAGVDVILVGDSLGNVVLGYDSTIPVTMEDMIHHTKAVVRGAKRAMVVTDMPFLSYHISPGESVRNAGRLVQEAGAQCVKLEGGREIAESVKLIVDAGIPVVGHLGLTPQSVNKFGGFVVQGKNEESAHKIIEDAKIIEQAGASAIVLECIPFEVAREITKQLTIPTIGIGAGKYCDGQVLVAQDMLGMYTEKRPKFVKSYVNLRESIIDATKGYIEEVKGGAYPEEKHSFSLDPKN